MSTDATPRKKRARVEPTNPDIWDAEQVGAYFNRSVDTIYLWVRTLGLPHHPTGKRSMMFERGEVLRWWELRKTIREPGATATGSAVGQGSSLAGWDGKRRSASRVRKP